RLLPAARADLALGVTNLRWTATAPVTPTARLCEDAFCLVTPSVRCERMDELGPVVSVERSGGATKDDHLAMGLVAHAEVGEGGELIGPASPEGDVPQGLPAIGMAGLNPPDEQHDHAEREAACDGRGHHHARDGREPC